MPRHFGALEHEWKDGSSWHVARTGAVRMIMERLCAAIRGGGSRVPKTQLTGLTAIMEGECALAGSSCIKAYRPAQHGHTRCTR